MKISVILCSCDRPPKLQAALASIEADCVAFGSAEIVLVYRHDDEATKGVMEAFAKTSRAPVRVCAAGKRGLSVARNAGVSIASGELLVFTDDDCKMTPGYLAAVAAGVESDGKRYDYGAGAVHDPILHAPGATHLAEKTVLKPYALFIGGIVNGCNMFFRKDVFQKIGLFREDMGAGSGMSFVGAEDLEMAIRASLSGLTGILLPEAIIIHDHGRYPGTREFQETFNSYDISRGSYYAYMLMRGIHEIWSYWKGLSMGDGGNRKMPREKIEVLQRELFGASEYLAYCLKNNIDVAPRG